MRAVIAEATEHVIPGAPWMYGVGAVVVLCAALYVLTRINPFR